MTPTPDEVLPDHVKDNYRGLHESTGESYDSIATRVESRPDPDPTLAAWLRSQHETKAEPPKGRGAARRETAEG